MLLLYLVLREEAAQVVRENPAPVREASRYLAQSSSLLSAIRLMWKDPVLYMKCCLIIDAAKYAAVTSPKSRSRKMGGMAELPAMTPTSGMLLEDLSRTKHGGDNAGEISGMPAFLCLVEKVCEANPSEPLDACAAVGLVNSVTGRRRGAEKRESARPVQRGGDGLLAADMIEREGGQPPFFNAGNANSYSGDCRSVAIRLPEGGSPVADLRPTEITPARSPVLDGLLHRSEGTRSKSHSEGTERAYKTYWQLFEEFCASVGEPALPARKDAVVGFLQDRIEAGLSVSVLGIATAAIRKEHLDAGKPDPTGNQDVRDMIRGYRRTLGELDKSPKQASGMTKLKYNAIVAVIRSEGDCVIAVRDIAVLSALRYALLRRGECSALLVRHFTPKNDGTGELRIFRSKTDQLGKGAVVRLNKKAASAIIEWMKRAGIDPATDGDTPLFRQVRRGGHVKSGKLSGETINKIVKKRGKDAGFDGLSGHSGRVGMAQDLAIRGASSIAIANAGRWKSVDMAARYARVQEAGQCALAKFGEEL